MAFVAVVAAGTSGGCSRDEASPQACGYGVRQDLDAGRYDAALTRLQSRACQAAMDAEQLELNRAAAYIGKAGYDIADLFLAVLNAGSEAEQQDADLRLLEALTGMGERGGLRFLTRANLAYEQMMQAFAEGLGEACSEPNVDLLSALQRDACFNSGLLAYARLARGFDLLLEQQLPEFLGLRSLDCGTDRNFSGIADEAEISACALRARNDQSDGGVCAEEGERGGQARGGIRWARLVGVPEIAFFEQGRHFASLVPIRVTTEPGGSCEGSREDIRLLQPRPQGSAEPVVTDGYCAAQIEQVCAAPDPALGCWPCPIPRVVGPGAVGMAETLLDAVNFEVRRALPVMPEEDASRVYDDLEEMRQSFCEDVEGTAGECEREGGDTRVNLDALREYFR